MKEENEFGEVVRLIKRAQTRAYHSINRELINIYWQVGEYISLQIARAAWGEKSVVELARFIEKKHPDLKGYSRTTLYRMRQFYETYKDTVFVSSVMRQIQNTENEELTIVAPAARQLFQTDIRDTLLTTISWTNHLIILARAKSAEERAFYIRLSSRENYATRELDRQISSGAFERVVLGNQQIPAPLKEERPELTNTFKSDYVLEFLNLPSQHSEGDLQKALIGQMKKFILEMLCKGSHNISYAYRFIM
jgi:predicted nuclease of restriction endonuclease-like (RecB) superfamily